MNKYNVVITQRAFFDISECVLFVNNVSNEAAKDLYQQLIKSISELECFPNKYPDIEGLLIAGTRVKRMPVHQGRYIVLYKIDKDTVTVYDVIDSRKDNGILKL